MANSRTLGRATEHDAWSVDHLRDRTSVLVATEPVVRLESGAVAPRISTIDARRPVHRATQKQTQGVTYVPGLICHPCSRPHAGVSRRLAGRSGLQPINNIVVGFEVEVPKSSLRNVLSFSCKCGRCNHDGLIRAELVLHAQ